ncbi:MAG: hypothetical protein U1F68_01540 [Gammaproteobacteria bacterium]
MSAGNRYLAIACRQSAVIQRTLAEFGDAPLARYLEHIGQYSHEPVQSRDDLFDVVQGYCAPLLGDAVAARVREDLKRYPAVLTTNHHGVDFFAQSVQGSLLFSLRNALADSRCLSTVPIFACGSVALNNLTYPRGVLLYGLPAQQWDHLPLKAPIFPDRFKRDMVCMAPAMDEAMLGQAEKRLAQLCADQQIFPAVGSACAQVMMNDYRSPQVLAQPDYSRQAVLLNHRLWKRLFANPARAPELIYLEIETITARLLELDLDNPASLAWNILFDPRLREAVVAALDGQQGCWDQAKLGQRLRQVGREQPSAAGAGTVFFWGIATDRKRVALSLENQAGGSAMLCGVDDHGNRWQSPLTAGAVMRGLAENRLLPSLFTCFLCIALARGVNCVGGYYQADYLPAMQRGIVAALRNSENHRRYADAVACTPTASYLAGMQAVMCDLGGNALVPAGVIEIIAAGGLDDGDLQRMLMLSVRDAHKASLLETIPDIASGETASPGWKQSLVISCYEDLKQQAIVKKLS